MKRKIQVFLFREAAGAAARSRKPRKEFVFDAANGLEL